MKEKVEGAKKM